MMPQGRKAAGKGIDIHQHLIFFQLAHIIHGICFQQQECLWRMGSPFLCIDMYLHRGDDALFIYFHLLTYFSTYSVINHLWVRWQELRLQARRVL